MSATTETKPARKATPRSDNPLHRLTPEQIEEIGQAFQEIHDEVKADLGERDAKYIRSIIEFHRRHGAIGVDHEAQRKPLGCRLGRW